MSNAPHSPVLSPTQTGRLDSYSVDALADDPHPPEHQTSTKQNHAFTRAFYLPPELLTEIFMFLRSIWSPEGVRMSRSGLPPTYLSGWMTVLHVCAFWRNAGFSAAVLWQEVDATVLHPDSIRDVLARSADLPLHLTAQDSHSLASWFDERVLRRLKTLKYGRDAREAQFPNLFLQDAPNIQQMILSFIPYTPLPPGVLGFGSLPHLRQLSLTRCSVPFGFSLFTPALTHLKLHMVDLDAENADSSVAQIISLLASLPALEYLFLCLYPVIDIADMALQHASLPFLKYFSLELSPEDEESSDTIISLLKHLSIPPTAEMVVHTDADSRTEPTGYQQLFSAISPDSSRGELQFQFIWASYWQWILCQWDPVTEIRMGKRYINIASDTDSEVFVYDLNRLVVSVRPGHLIILGEVCQDLSEDPWTLENLHEMEHVHYISISYCDCQHLWTVLLERPTLFPHLQTLILTDSHQSWPSPSDSSNENSNEFVPAESGGHECVADAVTLPAVASGLIDIVELLQHAGVPLREARIEGRPARWGGADALHTSFGELGDLKLVTDAPTPDGTMDRQMYSLRI